MFENEEKVNIDEHFIGERKCVKKRMHSELADDETRNTDEISHSLSQLD